MTLLGVALVVALYAAMSTVSDAMVGSFRSTGEPDEVVITQAGAITIDFSDVQRNTLGFVQTQKGVARQGDRPLVSPELYFMSVAEISGEEQDISIRGVTAIAPQVYSGIELVEGRWPGSGHAATIGRALARKLHLGLGDSIELEGFAFRYLKSRAQLAFRHIPVYGELDRAYGPAKVVGAVGKKRGSAENQQRHEGR